MKLPSKAKIIRIPEWQLYLGKERLVELMTKESEYKITKKKPIPQYVV